MQQTEKQTCSIISREEEEEEEEEEDELACYGVLRLSFKSEEVI